MRKGFTLAEVLITLGIIGVVAAVTIPTLVSKHQRTVYANQVKIAYRDLMLLLKNSIRESGGDNLIQAGFCSDGNNISARDYLYQNFKIVKDCGIYGNGCFADTYKSYDPKYTQVRTSQPSGYKVVLSNGVAISLYCYGYSGSSIMGMNSAIASIYIDTNSVKGPNKGGRDFFRIYVYPEGSLDGYNMSYDDRRAMNVQTSSNRRKSNFNAWCKNPGDTDGCLDYLIDNNWKMDY